MRILRCGEQGALVELEALEHVLGLLADLRRRPPRGVVELVPAASTLLVVFDPGQTGFDELARDVRARDVEGAPVASGDVVEIAVHYDGIDLEAVATHAGMRPEEVAELHRSGTYSVAFTGFTPGFAYLVGLDERLRLPRRATPRTRVRPGSVAIADRFTGIYPRESPGGWWIVGHTDALLWDLAADPPATLVPGSRVRFVEASA